LQNRTTLSEKQQSNYANAVKEIEITLQRSRSENEQLRAKITEIESQNSVLLKFKEENQILLQTLTE
jgi:cell shape-determining protein MreC